MANDLTGENRSRGWEALPANAPAFVRVFVQEYRSAVVEKRSMDANYLATFNDGCEKRSRTNRPEARRVIVQRTTGMPIAEARTWAKNYNVSFEDVRHARALSKQSGTPMSDVLNGMRLKASAARIAKANALSLQEQRDAILSDLSADGQYRLLQALDVAAGVRKSDLEISRLPYGFRSEDGGQPSDPQQSLRDDDDDDLSYDEGESAADERSHTKAVNAHRTISKRCAFERGCAHLGASDRHQVAINEPSPVNTAKAQEASRRANHWTPQMVS